MGKKLQSNENNENESFVIVSTESGAIVGTMEYGDKITKHKQIEHYEEFDDTFNKGENFVKIFDKSLLLMADKLTNGEIAFVIKLLPYISYKDGILRDEDKKILSITDLSKKMDLTHEGVRKVVTSLISKGVLGEHKTGSIDNSKILNKCITVNPFIFMKGRQMNRTIIGLFENSDWNI